VVAGRDDLVEPYLAAIRTELSWLGAPQEVDTLYFGGGTPTQLAPAELATLCELALQWHPLAAGYEWTVEANPGDLDAARVDVLAQAGATRLSLGAQSFRPEKLALLERDHTRDQIAQAVELAREAGLEVALDLMFAAPGETAPQWQAELEAVIALQPSHVSTYGLTFEQGTLFWNRLHKGQLAQVPEEAEREMYLTAIDQLQGAGFEHYEISNFAQPGHRSRHNEVYWSGAGYFAAGPGAARYVAGVRETNHRSTSTYLKRIATGESPVELRERLDPEARARERLVFGLRRLEGVDYQAFYRQTGFQVEQLAGEPIGRLVALGMLALERLPDAGPRLRLTREGLLVSDSLWPELL
jgi:oxygen-independent coproporphyrinogen-3 oxidase